MRKILQLGIFLLLVVPFTSALAQERTVSGKVTSLEDGLPLKGYFSGRWLTTTRC